MNALKTFKNKIFEVSAKFENGEVLFDVEQVSQSLGFTQKKNGKTYIRWDRVNSYLPKNSPLVGKGDLIPESLVYKLTFKASNEIAEVFQDWLAIEVLPIIRKHGAYMTDQVLEQAVTNPDFMIGLLTNLKEEQAKRIEAERKVLQQQSLVTFAQAIQVSTNLISIKQLAILMKQKGIDIGQNRLFEWLRENGYLCKKRGSMYNTPTQYSMDLGLFESQEFVRTNSEGEFVTSFTPKVTGKGQLYFINKFLNQEAV
ncbi:MULTISPECIES: phage antirepressor KilAC domain-containing protein [Bacillus]|uniref:Phage antirepressor KilAC domain-containing protein n=1 Tax=Bacillus proteolyticus TaxID=2026192 RepID=A0ABV3IHN9_9BACI|nr:MULTISPECIES: phage antirepressor KilAC domain-containing protein [Bacillus]MBJ8107420.1 phage antirepressor KilAC domain-containing protein [Bacillus cereus group sp. N8]OJD64776.1 antirepressor [Bacillus sp. NH11B]